jgi:hypothetical protein
MDVFSSGQRTHLAVSHKQQSCLDDYFYHPVHRWNIKRGNHLVPRHHLRHQQQPYWVQCSHHYFYLPQTRIILAMSKLKQAVFRFIASMVAGHRGRI